MNVLIIEDEARTARQLANLLVDVDPSIQVVGMLESVEEAVAWLVSRPQPDLIFSDIQLADGLSFDIYEEVKMTCPIIFCTAFDEYLMNAFRTNAISYLLKPITKAKIQAALDKFLTLRQGFNQETASRSMQQMGSQLRQTYKTGLLVNQREKIIPVQVKDIAYCYLDHSVVALCTLQQQKYFLSSTLDELEKTIDPSQFYRANRQYLISRQSVSSVERFFSRKLVVKLTLETPEPVVVSKSKAIDFLQWLESGFSPT